MAGVPPPYTQNDRDDPSVPIHGGYQQVPAKPQYGSVQPTTPASSAPSQPPPRTSTHNTVSAHTKICIIVYNYENLAGLGYEANENLTTCPVAA